MNPLYFYLYITYYIDIKLYSKFSKLTKNDNIIINVLVLLNLNLYFIN